MVAVQNGAGKARQRNQQQVGEGQLNQITGQRELFGVTQKTRCKECRDQRRGHHGDQREQQQRATQHAGHPINQLPDSLPTTPLTGISQYGHKGLRKRTLGKQPPQKVRDLERHKERIGVAIGADQIGQHHIAQQA